MSDSPSSIPPPDETFAARAWRGARFGARFTFWLLVAVVTLPTVVYVGCHVALRPVSWRHLLTIEGFMRFGFPAIVFPLAGAAIGAVVAGVLLPLAALLNGRPARGERAGYDEPTSPFDNLPVTPRSREELLRRIVGSSTHEPCEMT